MANGVPKQELSDAVSRAVKALAKQVEECDANPPAQAQAAMALNELVKTAMTTSLYD